MKKLKLIRLKQEQKYTKEHLKFLKQKRKVKNQNLNDNMNNKELTPFEEFCKFYDWFTLAGGEIPQEKYDILIKKFDYGYNL